MANLQVKPRFSSECQPEGRGKKKGSRNRKTILQKWLGIKTRTTNKLTGEMEDLSVYDQIGLALISKALEGDIKAIKEVQDTLHGRIPEQHRSTGTTEVVFRWEAGQLGIIPRQELPESIDGELLDNDDDSNGNT